MKMGKIRVIEMTKSANDASLSNAPVYRVFVGDVELSGSVVSVESKLEPFQYTSVKLEFLTSDFKIVSEDDLPIT